MDERVRDIDCYVSSPPKFIESKGARGKTFLRGIVSFYCPNPFFRSSALETMDLDNNQGIIPLTISGNAPTDFKIVFTNQTISEFGLVNIEMTKVSTGESIKLLKASVAQGGQLIIETDFGAKRIYYVDEFMTITDVWDRLQPSSRFFQLLPPGEDYLFSFTTETGLFNTEIQYFPKWLGV